MCGICGELRTDGKPADRDGVRRMVGALTHRGPDGEGYREDGPVILGHRRLAIIDPSELGNQPMTADHPRGSISVTYNGEIYNFPELRRELEEDGVRFRSRSDTEVLLQAYLVWGLDFLDRLSGMFALGLWDARTRRLLLARDRMGQKPLYYHLGPDRLVFASELKALLAHPAVPRALDPDAVNEYLTFEAVPCPRTILAGVQKLPTGHALIWEAGRARVDRYWEVPTVPETGVPVEEWERRLAAALTRAVAERLIADVPLGAFLSGGIDSATVVALMQRQARGRVRTFTIGFEDPSFDESGFARETAAALGTDHQEAVLSTRAVQELLPGIFHWLDEPLGDASFLPTYLLSRFTRESVTVALSGDGGDELFLGYPTYLAHRLAPLVPWLPRPVHRGLAALADRLPTSLDNISWDFKIKRFCKGLPYPPEVRNSVWLGSFAPAEKARLLTPDLLRAATDPDGLAPLRRSPGVDIPETLRRIQWLDLMLYMQDDILFKVDRASMAHGLEVRSPLLSHHVVELAARMPTALKLRGLRGKWLLKRVAARWLPPAILARPKKGFGIPVARWLREDLRWLLEEYLSRERVARQGLFRPEAVQTLVAEHLAGRRDHRKSLWTLLAFQGWHREYFPRG